MCSTREEKERTGCDRNMDAEEEEMTSDEEHKVVQRRKL